MKVEYSKEFIKSVKKNSGKILESVRNTIQEVIAAKNIQEITDCKKLTDFDSVYRIRIGGYRAFFVFHIEIVDDIVRFEYLFSRGEAYDKKNTKRLRSKDK